MLELRRASEPRSPAPVDRVDREALEEGPGDSRLCCGVCHAPITSAAEQLAIQGNAVHRRVNPSGVEYEFGCFAHAPGALAAGVPTAEHSWFAGYRWCYALCRGCSDHLGWHFRGAEPAFFGLILARLVTLGDATGGHA